MDETRTTSVNSVGIDGTHAVFIVDLLLKPDFDVPIFNQCIDSILAFGNSMLMQAGANKLTILGSSTLKNTILYLDQLADNQVLISFLGI